MNPLNRQFSCAQERSEFLSQHYSYVRLTYKKFRSGKLHAHSSLRDISSIQNIFWSYRQYQGLLFCERYIYRIRSLIAARRGDYDAIAHLLEKCMNLEKKGWSRGAYTPAISKTIALLYRQLSRAYLYHQDRLSALFALQKADDILENLIGRYPTYEEAIILRRQVRREMNRL